MKNYFHMSLVYLGILCSSLTSENLVQPGDHVALVGNTLADQFRTHGYLETLLMEQTKEQPIALRNLAWAGDTLTKRDRPTNFPSHKDSLKQFKADLILAFFGYGESFAGKAGLNTFKEDLKNYILSHREQSYSGKNPVRLVLVSPIACEYLDELSPHHQERLSNLEAYSKAMQEICEQEKISFIDIFNPTKELMEFEGMPKLTNNGIHLNAYGYWALSRLLSERLLPSKLSWDLSLNAKHNGKEFKQKLSDHSWASFAPPINGPIHPSLRKYRDTLSIKNLKPGDYTLLIDGQPVSSGSHKAWEKGKLIDSSPAHHELEQYRAKIQDKNQQFIYSWKALNQVHIVGERRKSPSGLELPAEVIRFHEISKQKQNSLKQGLPLKQREYRLIPQVDEAL
jgi:hypothetical protein